MLEREEHLRALCFRDRDCPTVAIVATLSRSGLPAAVTPETATCVISEGVSATSYHRL